MNEIYVALIGLVGSVLVAVITAAAAIHGTRKASNDSAALINYRIDQLEKKVMAHNQLIERTYKLEGRMNEAEHDIRDLKNR